MSIVKVIMFSGAERDDSNLIAAIIKAKGKVFQYLGAVDGGSVVLVECDRRDRFHERLMATSMRAHFSVSPHNYRLSSVPGEVVDTHTGELVGAEEPQVPQVMKPKNEKVSNVPGESSKKSKGTKSVEEIAHAIEVKGNWECLILVDGKQEVVRFNSQDLASAKYRSYRIARDRGGKRIGEPRSLHV